MLTFLPLMAAQAAAPNRITAEQALDVYTTRFQTRNAGCQPQEDPEAIVVCGRRDPDDAGPNSVRVPYVPEPGRRLPGEVRFDGGGCMRLCQQPVQVDVLKLGRGIAKGIERLLED